MENKEKNIQSCPFCNNNMIFDPKTQDLRCEYCNEKLSFEKNNFKIKELDYQAGDGAGIKSVTLQLSKTLKCTNCENYTIDKSKNPNLCSICGSSLKKDTEIQNLINPGYLVPFKLSKQEAISNFLDWLKFISLAPFKLKKRLKYIKNIQGTYIPYWTFDIKTSNNFSGKKGTYYYETESYSVYEDGEYKTKSRTVRKTNWAKTKGIVNCFSDDIMIPANDLMPLNLLDKFDNWDLKKLIKYDNKFTFGFQTIVYNRNLTESYKLTKEINKQNIIHNIKNKIGGDTQIIDNFSSEIIDINYKLILLPIWISAYKYKNEVYNYIINGLTGEVKGERPYSNFKIFLIVVGLLGFISLIIFLISK